MNDAVAAALALIRAFNAGDQEAVRVLMAHAAHRQLVIGLLAVNAAVLGDRADNDQLDAELASLQHALTAEELEG
ncbi:MULTISPECIES: hypothetical protein [Streptomyces]|uniref:hypothetical protein n=1 Tax=Streptomyces TaxID=1883 RepID=UPI0036854BC6